MRTTHDKRENGAASGFDFASLAEHTTGIEAGPQLGQQHQTRTFSQAGPEERTAHGAYCSCGWRSEISSTGREAEIAAFMHRVENTGGRSVISDLLDAADEAKADARGVRDQFAAVCEELGVTDTRQLADRMRAAAARQRFDLLRRTRVAAADLLASSADYLEGWS